MFHKLSFLMQTIIFLINTRDLKSFHVNFHYNYNLQVEPFNTQIYKRELTQFFDKASFSFNGFEKVESIPVTFPIDICVFSLEGLKYATALHMRKNGERHFVVLKKQESSYELIADIPSPKGIAMDCIDFNNKGYVAIAINITEPIQYAKEGSPLYEIDGNRIRPVQYFAIPNLTSVYLRVSGNDFFLLQSYANTENTPNLHCPYFKWSGSTFNKLGRIPCSNVRQLTPFSIDYESYVAVANYDNKNGYTSTNSEVYKYSHQKKRFVLFQKFETYGAVDVQYFNVAQTDMKMLHFLVFGNSVSPNSMSKDANSRKGLEADSVFYLFDKGQFIPYQKLSLYAVKKFLPVQNLEAEKFILLVACTDQDIKIYNFNDWKFEESKVQFTEGAMGMGVSNMRIYHENGNSFLVIANKLMSDNETNIFLPIFKEEQHTNTLRQQIIDWAKAETQRLETMNVKDLIMRVEDKIKNLEQLNYLPKIRDLPLANIRTVTTESLVYPKLKMSSDYWLALGYITQAVDALQAKIKQKQRLKRDSVFLADQHLEHVYDTVNVKILRVKKELKAKKVNKVNTSNPEFEIIKAKEVIVSKNYVTTSEERVNNMQSFDERDFMNVVNLRINGKINEYLWSDLVNDTLKRKGDIQVLKAPIQIEFLKTDSVIVSDDKINEQDLAALIPIDGGKYVIKQNLQFTEPINVGDLRVLDRLNNVDVFKGQLDVLLKKSNKTQIIKGLKNVTNVKVMEPITIAGKMLGTELEDISPIKFIHETLLLQGNFIINGDVHISHQLNTSDIIDFNEKLSTKEVLDMGIRMDKSLKDVNIKYLRPITANNSIVYYVNQHDLQRLVKLNLDDIQVIEGTKVFKESLEVRTGFTEVRNLNGIDIENLENKAFLKNNNQTIRVPMKIGKISTKSIESSTILLNSIKISKYLTVTGKQIIKGSLNIENLKVQSVTVGHLNTDSKIFHQTLQDIYQQKSRNAPPSDLFKVHRKFRGSIFVKNLILNTTINNKSVKQIEKQILQLEGEVKCVKNCKFNYGMNVTYMTFYGKLNDIPAEEFGKCWLQKQANKQVFTAEQTFAIIKAESGMQLQGKLNGFSMEDFYTKAIWINENEYIQCLNFEYPFEIMEYLTTGSLNGYFVPEEVLYKDAKDNHIFLNSITVSENFIAEGGIQNLVSINNINLKKLEEFLEASVDQTLYVDSAHFLKYAPLYETLNGRYIAETLESVWMTNDNLELSHQVEMKNAIFEGLLEFEGLINNVNMDDLKHNYFSKIKTQDVSVEIIFSKDVEAQKGVNTNYVQVFSSLIEDKSQHSINFNDFVKYTLKTSGPHIITGNWSLPKGIIKGHLNGVLVNGLNFFEDILLTVDQKETYKINAPKVFKNIDIENLYADSSSSVDGIPVANWIRNAVYSYKNYTIKDVTIIDSLNVYNNLIIFGKLNNITYNEYNILLKNTNQDIRGNMKIVSHLSQENRFLSNIIEQLYTEYVNKQHIQTFMENLIPVSANMTIQSHVNFKNSLKIEIYEEMEQFIKNNQWAKRDIDKHTQLGIHPCYTNDEMLYKFNEIKIYLKNITKNKVYKLEHFEILQTIKANNAELFMLNLKSHNMILDILAVWDAVDQKVTIYEWILKENYFRKSTEFDWLPHDLLALKIIHKIFDISEQPIDVTSLKRFVHLDIEPLSIILNHYNYFEFSNKTCMKFQNNQQSLIEFQIFCFNTENIKKIINFEHEVNQLISLGKEYVAVLTNSSILIYDMRFDSPKLFQELTTANPKQISLKSYKSYHFLAVINGNKSDNLKHGFVEIYRSVNSSLFSLFQSWECLEPLQIGFSFIEQSNDLLIHLLSSSSRPYFIYQYKGIMGFQEILSESTLPQIVHRFTMLNVYSTKQNLLALSSKHKITILNTAFNQIS